MCTKELRLREVTINNIILMDSSVTSEDVCSDHACRNPASQGVCNGSQSAASQSALIQRTIEGASLVSLTMSAIRSIMALASSRNSAHSTSVGTVSESEGGSEARGGSCGGNPTTMSQPTPSSPLDPLVPPPSFEPQAVSTREVAPLRFFSIPSVDSISSDMVDPSEPGSSLLAAHGDTNKREGQHSWSRKHVVRQQQTILAGGDVDTNVEGDDRSSSETDVPDESIDTTSSLFSSPTVPFDDTIVTPELKLLATVIGHLCRRNACKAAAPHNTLTPGVVSSDGDEFVVHEEEATAGQKRSPQSVQHQHLGGDSSSEAPTFHHDSSAHRVQQQQQQQQSRLWFRDSECFFCPPSRQHQAPIALNAGEQQFVLNCAFHCPIKPVARLFQHLLRALDCNRQMPREYRDMLISARVLKSAGGATYSTHRVPPASSALTMLMKYLDLLDCNFGRSKIPKPLCDCSRLQQAAAARLQVLGHIFVETGEVNNYYRVLSTFPSILLRHYDTMQFLFLAEGPLRIEERCMIAVMAAARHRCEYLVRRFAAALQCFAEERSESDRFLSEGPNEKLIEIRRLIGVLAHVPWSITPGDIEEVIHNGNWSIPELMQAMCIVTTILPLCGLTMGFVVPAELSSCAVLSPSIFPLRPIPPLGLFERGAASADDVTTNQDSSCCIDFLRYCGVDTIVSVPRINRQCSSSTSIAESTFNWQDCGGTLVEQFYPQFADLVTEEMAEVERVIKHQDALDMVRKTPDIEPSFVWRSLRLYLLNLIGVVVDDFQYQNINSILTRGVKTFVQKSSVYPDRLCLMDLGDWANAVSGNGIASSSSTLRSLQNLTSFDDEMTMAAASAGGGGASTTLTAPVQARRGSASADDNNVADRKWFADEVTLVAVATTTFETRREGLLLSFLFAMSQVLRNL